MTPKAFIEAVGNARLLKAPDDEVTLTLRDLEEVLSYLKQTEYKLEKTEKENQWLQNLVDKQEDTLRFLRGLVGVKQNTIKPPNLREFV